MNSMVRTAFVVGLTLGVALAGVPGAAHAEANIVSLKALLAVQDPAAPRLKTQAGVVTRPLAQADGDEATEDDATEDDATEDDATQSDDETPSALSGTQEEPRDADEILATGPSPLPIDDEEDSVFKTWWFWALTAAIVGGTVALGVWAAQPEDQPAGLCSPGVIACFGDGR